MCGITGFIHFNTDRSAEQRRLKKMNDIISHRGPDGEGFYIDKNIALGHRRLSIIDLNAGNQPMISDDGNLIITFNGEIYNYIELRQELIQLGYRFKTESDTEVILKAYEHWGYECQNKFNGMWGFAIWNIQQQELFVSRDRIGEKPIHYSLYDDSFIFGSEIKSLFEYGIPREERLELVEIYITLTNIPAPHTFYKNIFKLMPGHFILVRDGKIEEKKYWDLPEIDENRMLTNKNEIYEEFESLLTDSVRIRMRSDVPFGAFLSGGLDSSSVIALMSQHSKFPVNTFTIGFDDKAFDESKLAQEVADKFHTQHFRGTVLPDDFEDLLQKATFHYDEPFGDSSAIPTGYVSMFAAQKVKMVLTGDGGDEVLSGYTSYQGVKLTTKINQFPSPMVNLTMKMNDSLSNMVKGKIRYKLNRISNVLHTSQMDFNDRMIEKIAYTNMQTIKQMTAGISEKINIEDYFSDVMKQCHYQDEFYKLMFLNFKHDLPNDYLVKVDRMSMAHSLETRVPFLDHRLIEFMAHVDKSVKMQGWERKSVLRNSVGKKLPESILKAPKKGFGIPLREWFKDSAFNQHVQDNLSNINHIFDKKTVTEVVRLNNQGQQDYGNFIWTLIMLNKNLG
jgi:asparagine synthase (glutamine-hydrolysing)